jgi:hypothetical protein
MAKKLRNTSQKDLRTHHISSWFSDDELAELNLKRGKLSRGAFVRNASLDKKIASIPPLENLKAWQHLSHTTSNLNQLTKHFNTLNITSPDDIISVDDIIHVKNLINQLKRQVLEVSK